MTTHTRRLPGRFPLTLIRSQDMETLVAHPAALPRAEVAVPFVVDDAFYDDPDVCGLPDCSVAFLMLAGSWSARNSRSGFVPSSMLARFSGDPDLVTRTLQAAGFLRRAPGCGWQIVGGRGVTVVNAADVTAEKSRQEAVAEAERAGKSAGGQHGNHRRWHKKRGIHAPGCEFCEAETAAPEKRTSHSDRMRFGSDSDATPIDRSDLDPDLSSRVRTKQNPGRPAAHATGPKPRSQSFRLRVIAKFSVATGIDIAPEAADALAAEVLACAKDPVPNKLGYVLTAIDNEADPLGRWLPGYERPAAPKSAVPDWCRKCDETDRSIWDEQAGGLRWCPDCSPRTIPRWAA